MKLNPLFPKVACAFFAGLFLFGAALAQTPVPKSNLKPLPSNDNQFWNETNVFVPISKRVELNFLQFTRLGNNVSFRSDKRTGMGILIRLHKYYAIQPTYVYQYSHPGQDRKSFSHRLYVDNLIKVPTKRIVFANRIRFEKILRHSKADAWNFRVRAGIEVPIMRGDHSVSLFANDEIFYDTFFKAWTRNRFIAGVSRKMNSHFTMDVFYQVQNDSYARPGNLKVIGTTFKVKLDREK
jgi:hypothetical protein